jgi:hypothetical protein
MKVLISRIPYPKDLPVLVKLLFYYIFFYNRMIDGDHEMCR